jgi:predicted NBD/HSP70 family sugar kinase
VFLGDFSAKRYILVSDHASDCLPARTCQSSYVFMTRPMALGPDAGVAPPCAYGGAEVSGVSIRAGIFTPDLRLLGKTKLSTKLERGATAIVARIARCLRYASDESDLDLDHVRGVTIAIPGWVDTHQGVVRSAPELGWHDFPLQSELERLLPAPVRVANLENAMELNGAPGKLAVVFLRPRLTCALLEAGRWVELKELPMSSVMEAPERNLFRTLHHPEFVSFSSRDFRNAVRRGHSPAVAFLHEMTEAASELAIRLAADFQPDILALGGTVAEDLGRDTVQRLQANLRTTCEGRQEPVVMISRLGSLPSIAGGAAFSRQQHGVLRKPHSDQMLRPCSAEQPVQKL